MGGVRQHGLSPEDEISDLVGAWPLESAQSGLSLDLFRSGDLDLTKLPGAVAWHGPCADPLAEIGSRDLLVVPIWTETEHVVFEALPISCPFVGTSVGNPPAVVLAARRGHPVPPRRPQLLRTALDEVQGMESAELVAAGDLGRTWLMQERSFEHWQSRERELYAP